MSVSLKVSKGEVCSRSLRNKFYHEGEVPAVVYGYKIESTPISFDGLTLSKLLCEHGANTVIMMDTDRQKANTLAHKIQTNTFANRFEHARFLSVSMSEETEVETEVALVGELMSAKSSGMLAQNLYTVVISVTPDELPERIEVDVINLELGNSVTVTDLPKNDDYKFITDGEERIAAVVAQSREEENTGEGGEPKVVGSIEE